jgi:hypothetical protein
MQDDKGGADYKADTNEVPGHAFQGTLAPGITAVAQEFHWKSGVADRALDQVLHQRDLEVVIIERCRPP